MSMQMRPTTGTRAPRTSACAALPALRGNPSAYPIGSVAIRAGRSARHVRPYPTVVPGSTSCNATMRVRQLSAGSSTRPCSRISVSDSSLG